MPIQERDSDVIFTNSYFLTQLQEKGVYKAMSEFDIFINYIETYMTMKM